MFVSLRTDPLKPSTLKSVTGHNHRVKEVTKNDPRIDPARSHLNEHIIKTAETVEEAVQKRLDDAGTQPTKHSIYTAQEIVLSASPEYFRPDYDRKDPNGKGKYDPDRLDKWKNKTMEWLEKEYGRANLVDVVLHLDETTPHIHAVVVPIAEVELKKKRTPAEIKAGKENETYTKLKYKRTEFFDKHCLKRIQAEYGEFMNELGLYRGVPRNLTKKNHQTTQDWHRDQFLKTRTPLTLKSPEMDFKMETKVEGFKFPEPKLLETASSYKKRIEKEANDAIEEQLGDEYKERIKQYEEAFKTLKEYTESLYDELLDEKEQNKDLMKAMNNFVEVNTKIFEKKYDANGQDVRNILEEIKDEIFQKNISEDHFIKGEKPSDRIEADRKELRLVTKSKNKPSPNN